MLQPLIWVGAPWGYVAISGYLPTLGVGGPETGPETEELCSRFAREMGGVSVASSNVLSALGAGDPRGGRGYVATLPTRGPLRQQGLQ